jgi:hypothetical protein
MRGDTRTFRWREFAQESAGLMAWLLTQVIDLSRNYGVQGWVSAVKREP